MDVITLVRASVQGIVYFVDPQTGNVFSYDPDRPIFLGTLEKIPEEDKHSISKTNGCMATARVLFRSDIRAVIAANKKLNTSAEKNTVTSPVSDHGLPPQTATTCAL
jgi:hypothetical protein